MKNIAQELQGLAFAFKYKECVARRVAWGRYSFKTRQNVCDSTEAIDFACFDIRLQAPRRLFKVSLVVVTYALLVARGQKEVEVGLSDVNPGIAKHDPALAIHEAAAVVGVDVGQQNVSDLVRAIARRAKTLHQFSAHTRPEKGSGSSINKRDSLADFDKVGVD